MGRGHSDRTKRVRALGLEDSSWNSVLPEINQSINQQTNSSLSPMWGHSKKMARWEGSKQEGGSRQNPSMLAP